MKTDYGALTLKDLPPPPPGRVGWPWTKASNPLSNRMKDGLEWPRISIVTPSYNQGQFIEETIRSVLLQGYPNLEYIVIDGGSTDNSVEIIQKYKSFLAYWISEKDSGQSNALNKGLRLCSGEIIGWVNSDDLYSIDTFKIIQKAFSQNPQHIFIHGNRILIDADSNVTGWTKLPRFEPNTLKYSICSETAFWLKDAMEQVGYFNENLQFAMDLEFFGRLYNHGRLLKVNDYLGYFRCHENSKSSKLITIRDKEAEIIWQEKFGISNFREKALSRKVDNESILRKTIHLVANPKKVGIPYALNKMKHLIPSK